MNCVPAGSSSASGFGTIVSGYTELTVVLTSPGQIIANYAFERCTGLTSVTIPEGVTGIGESTFYGCTGLTSMTFVGSDTAIEYGYDDTFPNGASLKTAGEATEANGWNMSVGTYTLSGETWTKQ